MSTFPRPTAGRPVALGARLDPGSSESLVDEPARGGRWRPARRAAGSPTDAPAARPLAGDGPSTSDASAAPLGSLVGVGSRGASVDGSSAALVGLGSRGASVDGSSGSRVGVGSRGASVDGSSGSLVGVGSRGASVDGSSAAPGCPPASGPRAALRARLADPLWRVTALAGIVLCAALAVAQSGAGAAVGLVLVLGGVMLSGVALAPGAAAILRGPRARAVVLAGLLGPVSLAVLVAVASHQGGIEAALWLLVGVSALGGLTLLSHELHGHAVSAGDRAERTPWQQLTLSARVRGLPWRAGTGAALVAWAAIVTLALIAHGLSVDGRFWMFAAGLGVVVGVLALVGAPVLVGALAAADRRRLALAREDERLRVCAHLHDSVLQTLALIQRQAEDPAAVGRLARHQERALRSWMAGESEPRAATLADALHAVVEGVEADEDAEVQVTVLGDRPLDTGGEALAAAAREALRNAVRHAGGHGIVVFAELDDEQAATWICDGGPGFDLGRVPPERRGVRDAILGRMASAGGEATVESEAGAGTEVTLRLRAVSA